MLGSELSIIEKRILENSAKTKAVFPEETSLLEFGIKLMWDLTEVTFKAQKDFPKNPNLYANMNLFGRNRQLLTNAYHCMLSAFYGRQLANLRVVLENVNLMRLFNLDHRHAFEWLSSDKQKYFAAEVQQAYKGCASLKRFRAPDVLKEIFSDGKQKKLNSIYKIHGQLCDYAHPNFSGWQEVMGTQGANDVLLDLPTFVDANTDNTLKLMLILMQYTLKTFYETFKPYLEDYRGRIDMWQERYTKIIPRYTGK